MRFRSLGLRGRVALLVGLAALPALALTLHSALEVRARAEAEAREMLNGVSLHEAQVQEQVLDGARQTLVAMSLPLRAFLRRGDAAGCHAYLAELLQQARELYHSMGIFRPDGELFCNAVPFTGTVRVPDRGYFRLAREHKAFSVGEYQVGRVTGRAGINLGYAVLGESGLLEAVAFLGLDVAQIGRRADSIPLPRGVAAIIEDADGKVLASTSGAGDAVKAGEKRAAGALRVMESHREVGRNPDGRAALLVHVSIPVEVVFAEANRQLTRNLLLLALATAFVGAVAWVGTNVTIVPRLRALLRAAHQVRAGDLTARTGLPDDGEELSRVAAAFDRMAETLERREAELKAALQAASEAAATDPLTGLANRRHMEEQLVRELHRSARSKQPLALVLFDLDHFKRVNDTWGHEGGDEVLRRVAALLKAAVRGGDVACRYGGEELLIVLPGATAEAARVRAEAIRAGLKGLRFEVSGKSFGPVTASFGIAAFPEHGADTRALLACADKALYAAKERGRDRVELATAP
jgi:diguanylate cyclase (GGDEF)-like protein